MSTGTTTTPRISQLADQLIGDIRTRNLQPGDRFLTTAEASKLLGVGSSAANRALQILERRKVIIRQQRSGAFIAERPAEEGSPMLHRVHFLVHQKYLRTEGVGQDEVLLGIEHELPGVPVQISFLPIGAEAMFVRELVNESLSAKRADGFVLVRASYETQRLLAEQHIPTVVYGTLYPSIERLAMLTADMRATGRELTRHLLGRGHQRVAHFSRQVAYGGDHWTIEGITSELEAAGKGFSSLALRLMPDSEEVYLAEANRLLSEDNPPTGFICRTVRMADAVTEAAEKRGLQVGKEIDVTVCDYYLKPGGRPRYVHAKPVFDSEQQGRRLAQLLIDQVENSEEASSRHEIMPIELETPLRTTQEH